MEKGRCVLPSVTMFLVDCLELFRKNLLSKAFSCFFLDWPQRIYRVHLLPIPLFQKSLTERFFLFPRICF